MKQSEKIEPGEATTEVNESLSPEQAADLSKFDELEHEHALNTSASVDRSTGTIEPGSDTDNVIAGESVIASISPVEYNETFLPAAGLTAITRLLRSSFGWFLLLLVVGAFGLIIWYVISQFH